MRPPPDSELFAGAARGTRERHLLTAWIGPDARQVKRHDIAMAVAPARAYRAVLDLTLAELPLTRLLFRLRGIAHQPEMTVRELFTSPPFRVLEEQAPVEFVCEIARRHFRAVMNFRIEAAGAGSVVTTATWVETWGTGARVGFAIYWLLVAPFSGLIRREMLRVARRHAERQPGPRGPRLLR